MSEPNADRDALESEIRELFRGRTPEADVDVCFNGNIAVSQVKLL